MTTELEKHNMEMDKVSDSMSGLFQDACIIIEQAWTTAYRAVNETLIKRNWLLGMRIQHEVLKDKRAEYGEQVIRVLAKNLTLKYGAGYSRNNLYRYLSFYKSFPNIFQLVTGKLLTDTTDNIFHAVSRKSEIVPSLTGQSKTVPSVMGLSDQSDLYNIMASTYPLRLSWTHYSIILQESNAEARAWYENEAANEMWSTRTLQRNTSPICPHKRNFDAKSSNRRSFIGYRMGNEQGTIDNEQ